ncbi:hypothetical protein Btru_043109 [Bulinus truncatus]|nr:hypothetical protein Btru_043109 [Bulinus truncatus]
MLFQHKKNEVIKLKRRCKHYSKKISDLKKLLSDKENLCEEAHSRLQSYQDIPVELLKKPTKQYSTEQIKFASTLHYYGPSI